MRIALLANRFLDPSDVKSWSGLPYYMKRSLEDAGIETVTLKINNTCGSVPWARFLYWRWLRGKRYMRYCDLGLLKLYGRQFRRLLSTASVDAVFSPSTWLLAYLKTSLPTFLWTDACFAGLLNFYDSFTNIAPSSLQAGHAAEWLALHSCTRAVYSSQWAADTARNYYDVEREKVSVVPFGGNLEEPPTAEEVAAMVQNRSLKECNLLLISVDWARKGADIAVETVTALVKAGVTARLKIVGCKPPPSVSLPSFVEVIPFISKETIEGRRQLGELYGQSHFFILPSRAEAFGVVLAEANTFGVPCLTTNVGGLSSVIIDGRNGRLFSREARGTEYADYILKTMSDPGGYRKLALQSLGEATERLSWNAAGRKMLELFEKTVPTDAPALTASS